MARVTWTPAKEAQLVRYIARNLSDESIADKLRLTKQSVAQKARSMQKDGLLDPKRFVYHMLERLGLLSTQEDMMVTRLAAGGVPARAISTSFLVSTNKMEAFCYAVRTARGDYSDQTIVDKHYDALMCVADKLAEKMDTTREIVLGAYAALFLDATGR